MQEQKFEFIEKTGEIKKVVKPKILNRADYFLNEEEVKRIKEACFQFKDNSTKYHAMVLLMLQWLFSRHDLVVLRASHIDFERNLIKLEEGITKKRQPRLCPISNDLRRDLIQLTSTNREFVFMHKTLGKETYRRYSVVQINNIVARLGEKAGVKPKEDYKKLNTHLFRRSGVALMQKLGVDRKEVRCIGGWANFKYIDSVYGSPTSESIMLSRDKIEQI